VKNQIRRLTATSAARDRTIAVLAPAAFAPRRISECLAVQIARPSTPADPEFAADLNDIIRGHPLGDSPAWE